MINDDFNLETDSVAMPVLNAGFYNVNTVNVSFDEEKQAMVFQLVTEGNEQVKTDGETPADGTNMWHRLWFPRPGDAQEIGSNGLDKRQNKINMINRAFKELHLTHLNTPTKIAEAIDNGDLIGLQFKAKVELKPPDEWNPDMYNDIRNLKA